MIEFLRIRGLAVFLAVILAPGCLWAQDTRSILILDQSDMRAPFYYGIFSSLREVVDADRRRSTTLYSEGLDLTRFTGPAYEQSLLSHLKEKYSDKKIGVLVAVGEATLKLVLRWREQLWPGVPIVFAMVDEGELARLKLPPDVTGGIVTLRLSDSIKAARAVVPNLKTVVFVGDVWESQVIFGNWKKEIPAATAGLNVIEIIGQTLPEIRKRVAKLPNDSAIIYSAVYSDGLGTYYLAADALSRIAETANRPIIVAAETFLKPGGIGGYVVVPSVIGAEAGKTALRILDGERMSHVPLTTGGVRPIFNWEQMQRWNVDEASLPTGSIVRFRDPGMWERYRWQTTGIMAVLLLQASFISILLHERKRRHNAEIKSRNRMNELAHVNRNATASELSSSIAHELSQPLGAILTNTETAELILNNQSPDLNEVKEIVSEIKRDDLRASEVIRRLRHFLTRAASEKETIDLNVLIREVFEFLSMQASARNVALYLTAAPGPIWIDGDRVQLQQVFTNLIVNSMDAMDAMPYGRMVTARADVSEKSAVVSVADSGPGIPTDKLTKIFDSFFTTKEHGMGIGLSIARTIITAHQGHIWAESQNEGGAVIRLSLPLSGS